MQRQPRAGCWVQSKRFGDPIFRSRTSGAKVGCGGGSRSPRSSDIVRQARIAADPYRAVLESSVEAAPGTAWNYNGGGVWLLGLILKKVSGLPLDQFAKEALFEPLGIKDWAWERFSSGDPYASGGLQLRPRDLAKLGQLVLDDGVWQGRQIVSIGWIKEMTTRHNPDGMWFGFARGYGYLWWLGR